MSVVNLSASSRIVPESELQRIARLTVALSGRLTRELENCASAIADALSRIADATHVETCQLIEFSESGAVARVHQQVRGAHPADVQAVEPVREPWLTDRLARGEVVAISQPEELPWVAAAAREKAHRTRAGATLGVPASVAGRVVCALVLESERVPRRWPQPLIEQLQLLSEILAGALMRARHENTLRANIAMIEQLNARLTADNAYLKEEIQSYHDFDDIVGESVALRLALTRLAQVAPTNSNVLLLGQTGTGKELFARALHERSRRHARPLVRVNCAALPPTLVESELFGHEKGAFTGAVGMRQGRFELADGGTIFLDEIGDLAPDIQVKFLRVLQEGEFERVGSSRPRHVDVRVIAATHHDLEAAVAEGRFRADLFYRLSVFPIRLPSLRERADDIPRLVWFFIHRHQRSLGRHITKVPKSVMDVLQRHSWPGNIRELENVVERAMIASSGDTFQLDGPMSFDRWPGMPPPAEPPDNLDAVQREHIRRVLDKCKGKINGTGNAAERLGLHPNTLRFRMKKLGVMMSRISILLAGLAGLTFVVACGPREPTTDAERLTRGRELIQQMSAHLGAATLVSATTTEVRDLVRPSRATERVSLTGVYELRRPDRFHVKQTGHRQIETWYDGKRVTVAVHEDKVFAQAPMPENINRTLDALAERYDLPLPMADLFYGPPEKALLSETTTGGYVGTESIGDTPCYHLAFQDTGADWEVWLPVQGDPLPKRFKTVQKRRTGKPMADVTFVSWNLAPAITDATFSPKLPAEYEGIAILQRAAAVKNTLSAQPVKEAAPANKK